MGTTVIGTTLHHPNRPIFRTVPTISGTFAAGNTLTYNVGTWVASPTTVVQRIDTFIGGLQEDGYGADSFDLTADHAGSTIQIGVAVQNTQGATYQLSAVYDIDALTLAPPVLSTETADTATTKVILISFPQGVEADDVLDLEHSANADMSSATAITYTVLSADVTAGFYEWAVSGLSVGARYFRVRNTRLSVDGVYSDILSTVVVPSAPTVAITTAADDNTPTARVTFGANTIATYIVKTEWSASADFSTIEQTADHTIVAGDITAGYYDATATTLADGLWYVRANVRASASLVSPWSNVDSETIATVVTSGAPVIADQVLRFGRNTLSGAGAKMLVNTGGAPDGSGTCTLTGNSDFTINAATGVITPTGTRGKASPLPASSTATVTYVNAFGSDSCTVTFTCETDAYDYVTTTELTNAINNARPGSNGDASSFTADYVFYQVEGTSVGLDTGSFYVRGKTMAGTLTEPNDGVTTVAGYNRAATGACSGGSMHITCRTQGGATFLPALFCTGSGPLIVSNLVFGRRNSTGTNSAANQTYQILATDNANWPAVSKLWVHHCTFGATSQGTAQAYWTRTGDLNKCHTLIFEDNTIDGGYAGVKVADTGVFVYRRNAVRRIVWDHIFYNAGFGSKIEQSTVRYYISDNTLWDRKRPLVTPGQHADPFQSGVAASVNDSTFNNKPQERVIVGNIWDFTAENIGTESYSQGYFEAYQNNLYTSIVGEIAYNLLICEAPNGLTVSASIDTEIFDNTLVFNTNAPYYAGGGLVRGGQWESSTSSNWTNNIFSRTSVPFDSGTGMTHSGTVNVDPFAAVEASNSFESNFDGPFVRVSDPQQANGLPSFDYDKTSAATVRADLISMFTTKGASAGKGFTVGIGS